MLARLKSKKIVELDNNGLKFPATPHCEIITWTQGDNSEDGSGEGFSACGRYYYFKENEIEGQPPIKTEYSTFDRPVSKEKADALFEHLNIQYPEDATYSKRGRIDVLAGLKAIVAEEKRWGLTGADWEEVI